MSSPKLNSTVEDRLPRSVSNNRSVSCGARTPGTCCFRRVDRDGVLCCELVRRLTDSVPAAIRVDAETCVACCRSAEPTETHPNGVVASLAHAEVSRQTSAATDPQTLMRAAERLAWIEQYVELADSSSLRFGFEHLLREPWRRGRRWLQQRLDETRRDRRRIGLIGPNNVKGLGHQNRDLEKWLPIDDWLRLESEAAQDGSLPFQPNRRMTDFLRNVDVLLFVETPFVEGLPKLARELGVRVVCVPNWECLHPGLSWLRDVDLMICPTRRAFEMLTEWRSRFGFAWDLKVCPWPIDVDALPFRLRETCRRFVFVNGTDQVHPRLPDGTPTCVRRKGLEWLIEAARRLPNMPFIVWSQTNESLELPGNITWRKSAQSNKELYDDGDICVQLSRWEGIGLPLLECQAAGMPLITIDEAPMNEHSPLAVIPVADYEPLELWPRRWIAAPRLVVDDLTATLASWFGRDISQASRQAREFVEREHSWRQARSKLLGWIAPDRESAEETK